MKRPTLSDIAKKAGVTIAAVSMALKNHPRISPETCKRIQKIAEQLNYTPDPVLSSLIAYRETNKAKSVQATIAYIDAYSDPKEWKKLANTGAMFEGASKRCLKYGYKLEEFRLHEPGMTQKRLSKILFHRGIKGIVIGPMPQSKGHLNLEWDKFSSIALGHSLVRPKLHLASSFHSNGIVTAFRKARKYGYRNIGLALPLEDSSRINDGWVSAFLTEHFRNNTLDPSRLFMPKLSEWMEKSFKDWVMRFQPDAVIGVRHQMVSWIGRMGLRVPEDVAYIGLNVVERHKDYAGIFQNPALIGASAIDFLVGLMQRNERGIPEFRHAIHIEGSWMDGPSCPPKNRANL